MKRNVGGVDRAVRAVAGLVILGLGVFYRSWWGLVGLIPLATALLGWCPLYCPFKISTRHESPGPTQ
jgi:hypothetical protein